MRTFLLLTLLIFIGCEAPQAANNNLDIIFVRHAEKNKGNNPDLTPKGKLRADSLKYVEKPLNIKIKKIYSSNVKRTLQTATPTSKHLNVKINSSISPMDYGALKKSILEGEASSLVVGHSNTIPGLINHFYPTIKLPMIEENNFSSLFKISIKNDGSVTFEEFEFEPKEGSVIIKKINSRKVF